MGKNEPVSHDETWPVPLLRCFEQLVGAQVQLALLLDCLVGHFLFVDFCYALTNHAYGSLKFMDACKIVECFMALLLLLTSVYIIIF